MEKNSVHSIQLNYSVLELVPLCVPTSRAFFFGLRVGTHEGTVVSQQVAGLSPIGRTSHFCVLTSILNHGHFLLEHLARNKT